MTTSVNLVFDKIVKTIESLNSAEQLDSTKKYIDNFLMLYQGMYSYYMISEFNKQIRKRFENLASQGVCVVNNNFVYGVCSSIMFKY